MHVISYIGSSENEIVRVLLRNHVSAACSSSAQLREFTSATKRQDGSRAALEQSDFKFQGLVSVVNNLLNDELTMYR